MKLSCTVVGIVVIVICPAISPIETRALLTSDVIYDAILPPLLFEVAIIHGGMFGFDPSGRLE